MLEVVVAVGLLTSLIDDQRDHAAGIHARIHLQGHAGIVRGDPLRLRVGSAAGRNDGTGQHGNLRADVDRSRNAVGGDEAGLGDHARVAGVVRQAQEREQFLGLADQHSRRQLRNVIHQARQRLAFCPLTF